MIGVPRKVPKNHSVDNKGRKWLKATEAPIQKPYDNEYYVWFKKDTVPVKDEIVFGMPILEVYRYKYLLRCRVLLGPKKV